MTLLCDPTERTAWTPGSPLGIWTYAHMETQQKTLGLAIFTAAFTLRPSLMTQGGCFISVSSQHTDGAHTSAASSISQQAASCGHTAPQTLIPRWEEGPRLTLHS